MIEDYAIRVENVSKSYNLRHSMINAIGKPTKEFWALRNVSINIKKGESVGIIGPNGSGKSTLLKLIAGVIKPTEGKIIIDGNLASILDIGAGFHPELSGMENILINGQLLGFTQSEIRNMRDKIIEFCGINEFIHEPVKNYSSGMYLRLAFSIVINLDADIYLFDEVLAVGDQEFRNKCFAKLRERVINGKTNLMVSHERSLLSLMTSRIIEFPQLTETVISSNFVFEKDQLSEFSDNIKIRKFEHHSDSEFQIFTIELSGIPEGGAVDVAITIKSVERPSDYLTICSLHPLVKEVKKRIDNYSFFKAHIPSYTIINGRYEASLRIIYNSKFIIKNFEDSLLFDVNEAKTPTDIFYNKYPGSIRIKADWEIKL